ncbi:conserved hypothetical protein [Culex quinquefasciatus]|uniref:CRAL-TRIO domain-containing protein n=1 Tax=Culex quinquefasciatus TaxID=7176 RepID=B0X3T1_CULQU|nr:conserved hypothetical protein [Culex quinquefasciatus]|eukprot:XP_001864303.1 conserved hypothetical protein [Culex quinquefasciatus]
MSLKFDDQGAPFIEVGPDICLKLELSEYDDDAECVRKAREELRETPEVVQESLTELRSLLKEHSDLNIPVDDDAFLKKFLRPTKYYPQSALNMVLGWYKFKANKKFVTDDMSTNRIRVALEEKIVQLLPKRDQLGRRIIFVEMGSQWDCSKVSYPELVRAVQAMIIIALLEPRTQLHGIQFVANFDRMSLAHLVQFTPKFAKLSVDCSQKYTPMRTKEINLVHNSEVFNVMFKIFKPFLGQKWNKRIHFHGNDMNRLHKYIDTDCLPLSLGGTLDYPEVDGKVMADFVEQYEWHLKKSNSYGYKEEEK